MAATDQLKSLAHTMAQRWLTKSGVFYPDSAVPSLADTFFEHLYEVNLLRARVKALEDGPLRLLTEYFDVKRNYFNPSEEDLVRSLANKEK